MELPGVAQVSRRNSAPANNESRGVTKPARVCKNNNKKKRKPAKWNNIPYAFTMEFAAKFKAVGTSMYTTVNRKIIVQLTFNLPY